VASREESPSREGRAWFSTTHWSVVLKARSPDEAESRDALSTLCQAYWSPVFSYIRHRGHDAETARDLTQGFFAALLGRRGIAEARREKGRFRSFLLGSVKNFLCDENDYRNAQKRGGGQTPISIDADTLEAVLAAEALATHVTPETLFEQRWALALLDHVLLDLEREMEDAGSVERFRKLSPYLVGDADSPYPDLAQDLGITETGVRVALHRMRQRFGAKLRDHVARTLDDPDKAEDELRYLMGLMRA
jgi:DNA-directed RNA polymerase specialized sigma24 family protein